MVFFLPTIPDIEAVGEKERLGVKKKQGNKKDGIGVCC
jgi:hypothetical protein